MFGKCKGSLVVSTLWRCSVGHSFQLAFFALIPSRCETKETIALPCSAQQSKPSQSDASQSNATQSNDMHWKQLHMTLFQEGGVVEYDLAPYQRLLRCPPGADFSNLGCLPAGGPGRRAAEKSLSGLDPSQRLQNSRRIHVGRFSGPGDHSGSISGHFCRFGHLGLDPHMRLQHWHSTLTFNIGIQH